MESQSPEHCLRVNKQDLSAIAVNSIVDAERMFGKNSEDFLENVQTKKDESQVRASSTLIVPIVALT